MCEMIDRVAKAMWERTHDGRWEERGDGQDMSRDIHLEDARVAIETAAKVISEQHGCLHPGAVRLRMALKTEETSIWDRARAALVREASENPNRIDGLD